MSIHVLHDGTVKSAIPYVKYNGSVVVPTSGWAKTGGELKQIWPPVSGDTVYIYNQATLEAFRDRVNAGERSLNALVVADITLTGEWTPIANYASDTSPRYTGTFDGGGHTITGLTINSSNSYQGLFGHIGLYGTIKNVKLASTSVTGNSTVGGIVGWNDTGTVQNCTNSGEVSGTDTNVGGIVGHNFDGIVQDCTNSGKVSGSSDRVGGIVGHNYFSTVRDCTNSGEVSGNSNVGGIAGWNEAGTVSGNSNSGNVTATSSSGYAGGVVGYSTSGTVSGNTNTGTVTGAYITELLSVGDSESLASDENSPDVPSATGGIIGYNEGGTVEDNTNSGSVSGGMYTGDIIGYDAPVVSGEEEIDSESSDEVGASSEDNASNEAGASNDSAADEE